MKNEFKFELSGGYLFVVVFLIAVTVLFACGCVFTRESWLRMISFALVVLMLGLLWWGYYRSFGCRSLVVEDNMLVVQYWFGGQVCFELPQAVSGIHAYSHDARQSKLDSLQLVLRNGRREFLLTISCFTDAKLLLAALENRVPINRRLADGSLQPSKLGEIKRGEEYVAVVRQH